jgi:hypothetical protein
MMDGRSEMHLSAKPVGSYDATLRTNLPASKTAAVRISRKPVPMTEGTAKQPLVTTKEAEVLENFPVWPTFPQKSAFSIALNSKARMHKLPSYVSVSTGSDRWNGDLALEDTDFGNTDETPPEEKHPYDTQPERSYWKSSWIWEILSAGASVCAFVAIIVVLNHYDERAIPTLPLGVTVILDNFYTQLGLTRSSVAQRPHLHPGHRIKSYDDDGDCGGDWAMQMAQIYREAS